MAGRIQLRRGTAANWTSANPVLAAGEIGVETDTGRAKAGDGSTAWTSLTYIDSTTRTDLAAHLADTTDAHLASAIGFTPVGTIAATNTQSAVAEVATDAAAALSAHTTLTSTAHGISAYGATLVDDADATAARTTLGLGSIATQASNSVTITGGSVTGITDLAVADGGTGASTAATALSNLGGAAIHRRMKTGQYYGPAWDGLDTVAALSTLGAVYTVPFIAGQASKSIDRIGVEITTGASAGGVVRLGVYNDDGNGYPGTLLFESSALASTATGAVTETISQTLSGGLYWLAIVAQVAGCSVRAKNTASSLVGENSIGNANVTGYLQTGITSGGLPSTFTASVFAHQVAPKIMVRAANP